MPSFVDRVVVQVSAGHGGAGCCSIRREKFKPLAGPDGGNGGKGGDVTLVVDPGVTTLLDYHYRPHRQAGSGQPGQGNNRHGANGGDLLLRVPNGTVVSTESGTELADLVGAGTSFVVARGGNGGLGNAALASARRKAPGFALKGEPGQSQRVVLELKTVADVALVGYPSAGKSSLIAAVSAAKPKIADYPFTTLVPNLGVVDHEGFRFTLADVPGLIPGASTGKGLGLEFLRHIERCAVIVHVLDCATLESGRDPLSDLDMIETELAAYGGLADKPRLVVLNKIDVTQARELAEMVTADLQARNLEVFAVSAASHEGLRPLLFAMAQVVGSWRASAPVCEPTRVVLRPHSRQDKGFSVRKEGEAFRVLGEKPQRWVQQTDFTNDEAVGYLADRLARLGVEEALVKAGATAGCEVMVGPDSDAVVFDWVPTLQAGAAPSHGPRGTDLRLDQARAGAGLVAQSDEEHGEANA